MPPRERWQLWKQSANCTYQTCEKIQKATHAFLNQTMFQHLTFYSVIMQTRHPSWSVTLFLLLLRSYIIRAVKFWFSWDEFKWLLVKLSLILHCCCWYDRSFDIIAKKVDSIPELLPVSWQTLVDQHGSEWHPDAAQLWGCSSEWCQEHSACSCHSSFCPSHWISAENLTGTSFFWFYL